MAIININIPSQLPVLTGSSLLYLRVNVAEDGIEWAATAGGGITIGTTAIASGTVGRVIFEGAGNVVQQNANFFWNNTDSRLGIRESSPDSSVVIRGAEPATSTTTFGLKVHNSTGTNNAFVVRDDGFVGIGTNAPLSPLTIGSVVTAQTYINNVGGNVLSSRQDGNHRIQVTLINQAATGANTAALFGGRAGDMQIAMGCTNESYNGSGTNQYLGGEVRSGVIIAKASSTNVAKLKFTVINSTNAAINKFEWISGTAISGTFTNGTTATPIMTLVGNGNLLIGTVTDVASSILTLNSTTKGFLPPRMTTAERDAIVTPATGLMIYNTTTNRPNFFDGTNWIAL